jgi:hypothetical protein
MAKGSNSFKNNPERARLAGRKSSRAIPPELKELRAQKQTELEQIIYKYTNMTLIQLKEEFAKPEKAAIDLLVMKCMIKGIEKGDFSWIEPMLARSIGKVVDKHEITATRTHEQIINLIEAEKKNGV